jgi:hypothetical protein
MKLRHRSNEGPPVSLRLKVPGELHSALASYAEYYKHQHGDRIDVPALMLEIIRTFVTVDREFRAWRRNGHEPVGPTETGRKEVQGESR